MNVSGVSITTVVRRAWGFDRRNAIDLRYAFVVSIWVRWAFLLASLVETSYRIEYGSLSHVLNTLYVLGLMSASGYVWWRIRSSGRVDLRWLLALSGLDLACGTFTTWMSGGLDGRYFPMYYLAVALFAWLFTSPWLAFSWTTLAVALYVAVCLVAGDGVDVGQQEEKVLFYRVLGLYLVAVSVNMVTRFERVRRVRAVEREGELNRQRIEISQTIHDTTAQSSYMLGLGLGLEQAADMVERSDPEAPAKLRAMSELSRSAMWELRHPIDGGQLFSGASLGEVLADHADTFTVITSIPADLVRCGEEPELSPITRSLLFSIAHNALTNAFRHSAAGNVSILLDFAAEGLRLSVSDDGVGLPEDYAARGHGFRNMQADAQRLGGVLEVESGDEGTTVSCFMPYPQEQGGR